MKLGMPPSMSIFNVMFLISDSAGNFTWYVLLHEHLYESIGFVLNHNFHRIYICQRNMNRCLEIRLVCRKNMRNETTLIFFYPVLTQWLKCYLSVYKCEIMLQESPGFHSPWKNSLRMLTFSFETRVRLALFCCVLVLFSGSWPRKMNWRE